MTANMNGHIKDTTFQAYSSFTTKAQQLHTQAMESVSSLCPEYNNSIQIF